MRLTRLKALELCKEMWRWLANNPTMIKEYWPGWKKYGNAQNDCWACEYNCNQKNGGCGNCILYGLWGSNCITAKNSPYYKWDHGKNKKKNALIIADFCKKEIARLEKKKKCLSKTRT